MSQALRRVTWSPFTQDIERIEMPRKFTWPPFTIYYEKTDPVERVSHYIQMMSLYLHNDALMSKVLLLSLGLTAMRWFTSLRKGSIHNFGELIQSFGAWFVTCSKVPNLIGSLLSMRMRSGETL